MAQQLGDTASDLSVLAVEGSIQFDQWLGDSGGVF